MDEIVWQKWIQRAEDNLKWARDNYEDGNYQLVGYLCQQSIEILLKGLLYRNRIRPPKIHDLFALAKKIENFELEWSEFKEDLELLSSYYFELRYPGEEGIELNQEQAKQAIEDVEKIWEKVRMATNL